MNNAGAVEPGVPGKVLCSMLYEMITWSTLMPNLIGNETELLDFMKRSGFPVFHLSNMFFRDVQYAVRDYYRASEGKDIGTRKADELAAQVIADMEKRGILAPHSRNTWVLHHERYLVPKAAGKEAAADA